MLELLDSDVSKRIVNDGSSNLMDRVRHLYIDGIIVFFISMKLIFLVISPSHNLSGENDKTVGLLILSFVYLMYYTSLEFLFGFTIGKFLNKTRVVSLDKTKLTLSQILIRTFSRVIPFGHLGFFTKYDIALHDQLSKTKVVRRKKKYIIESKSQP